MYRLIVKKDMRAKRAQHLMLGHTTEEEGFVYTHIPCAKRADDALMRGRVSRGNKRSPYRSALRSTELTLNQRKSFQELCKRSLRKRLLSVFALMLGKRREPFFFINLF